MIRENNQPPDTAVLLMSELSGLLPTTNPKSANTLPYGLCTYPRTVSTSPSPAPFSIANICLLKQLKSFFHKLIMPKCPPSPRTMGMFVLI